MFQAHDEARQQNREYEETKRQIEEDADREILDMKNKYERKLKEEKEANTKLKGETGIMRKKFLSLQTEIGDQKEDIKRCNQEISKLNTVIRNLEKDIAGLKKEIQERDETIQDKVSCHLIIIHNSKRNNLNVLLNHNTTKSRMELCY